MKKLSKIWVLVTVALLSSTMCRADAGFLHDTPELHPTQEENSSSAYPVSKAYLFSIHHPGGSGVNFLERLPKSNSAENSRHDNSGYLFVEFDIQRYAKIQLCFFQITYRSLTVKKLIFPFHSHW